MEGTDGDGKTYPAPAGHGSIVTKPTPCRPQPGGSGNHAEMNHQPLDGMFSSSMYYSGAGDLAFLQQSFSGFDFRMDSPGGSFGGLMPFPNMMDMGAGCGGLMAGPSTAAQVEAAASMGQLPVDASRPAEVSAQEHQHQQQQQQQEEPRMLTRSGINHAKPPLSVRPPVPGGGGGSFAERMAARANKSNALAVAGRQATARFKAMPPSAITMPGPRTTSGNYLTIPPGLSPTTLLDSPAVLLLPTSQAEPSPTTGTYSLPSHYNGSGTASGAVVMMDGSREVKPEPDSGLGFIFKPIPKALAPAPVQSFAPSMKAEPESAEPSVSPADPTTAPGAEETVATEEGDEEAGGRGRAAPATSQARDFVSADDGYNWRKYGQKQVKGCAQPRSYYKCTHPHCPVKKKVERSVDGTLIENVVKGVHIHPKPVQSRSAQLLQSAESREPRDRDAAPGGGWGGFQALSQREGGAELADSPEAMGRAGRFEAGGCGGGEGEVGKGYRPGRYGGGGSARLTPPSSPSSAGDELSGAAHTPPLTEEAEDDELEPDTKRRKGEGGQRTLREPRVVVMTKSNVDILDDGYRWRKYGQKTVKGNPHPRSYYKCTYPDCGVRKHVERASHDSKSVMTTYEGKHNHELPAARTGSAALAVVGQTENKASESGGWAAGGSPEPALEEEEDQNQVERSHRGWGSLGGMLEDCVRGGVMRGDEGLLRRRLRVAGEGSLSALLSSDGLDGSMQMSQGPPTRGLASQHLQEGGSGYALRSATMDGNTSSVYGSIGGGGSSSAFRPGSISKVMPR